MKWVAGSLFDELLTDLIARYYENLIGSDQSEFKLY